MKLNPLFAELLLVRAGFEGFAIGLDMLGREFCLLTPTKLSVFFDPKDATKSSTSISTAGAMLGGGGGAESGSAGGPPNDCEYPADPPPPPDGEYGGVMYGTGGGMGGACGGEYCEAMGEEYGTGGGL